MTALDVPFKGSRDYLQGPDLFDAVVDCLRQAGWLDDQRLVVAFRSFARHACVLAMGEIGEVPPRPAAALGSVTLGEGAGRRIGWIIETDCLVARRVPFPEEEIVAAATFADRHVEMVQAVPFRPAEIAVALIKHMHQTLMPVPDKRWIVSKIDLARPLPDDGGVGMSIDLVQAGSAALTRSRVRAGDAEGDFFFSQVGK